MEAAKKGYCGADAQYSMEFKAVAYPIYASDGALFGCVSGNARKIEGLTERRFRDLAGHCKAAADDLGGIVSY